MSIRITDLPEAGTLTGSEIIPVVQGGVTKKASTSALIVSAVTSLADHIADHSTHGTTGNIVGDTDVQTLANKSVSLASNTLTGNKSEFDAALSNGAFAYVDSANTFTVNQVVSVTDNTNAALRITQLGTGNALVVEDSANPDSTPFVIDANGRTVVNGTTAGIATSGVALGLTVNSNASIGNALGAMQWSADTVPSFLTLSKSRGASVGTQGAVLSGDGVGTLLFTASDATNHLVAARIDVVVDGTPGANDMPGRLVFSTTADNQSTPTERMRIDAAGNVGIGGAASGANLHVKAANAIVMSEGTGGYGSFYARGSGTNNSYVFFGNAGGEKARLTSEESGVFIISTGTGVTERMRIDGAGNIIVTSAALLGYGTGAGGTVTQATSKSTAVTLNKPSGHITMEAGALAAGAAVTFIVNNSLVTANDTVIPNLIGGVASSAAYRVELENTNAGLFRIRITNISAGSLSEAVVLHYNVIKGSST